jgi:hypothetical protein
VIAVQLRPSAASFGDGGATVLVQKFVCAKLVRGLSQNLHPNFNTT